MSSRCRLRGRSRLFDAREIPLQVFMIEGFLIEREHRERERLRHLPLLNWRKRSQ
jgi:hypothetical protein